MKRCVLFCMTLFFCFALCACGGERESELRLYCPSTVEWSGQLPRSVTSRDYWDEADPERLLRAELELLFGRSVELENWTLTEGKSLTVELSDAYAAQSGIDLTLSECCITLTLCQLEQVERVRITVDGRQVNGRDKLYLTAEDFLFTGAEEEPRQVLVELYFPRTGGGLGFEVRELTLTEDDDLYTAVLEALLEGPDSQDLTAVFPDDAQLLDVRMDDGVCCVNFSASLTDMGGDEAACDLLLYSIVDTLGRLDAVSAVQLLVEGETLPVFGTVDTSLPVEPDFELAS